MPLENCIECQNSIENLEYQRCNICIEPICPDCVHICSARQNGLFSYRRENRGYSITSFDIIIEDL